MLKECGLIYSFSIEEALSTYIHKTISCSAMPNIFLFRVTIKTRLCLQPLLNYNPNYDQPMYAQHHSAQNIHKEDRKIDDDDLLQRQKLLATEPEVPEK